MHMQFEWRLVCVCERDTKEERQSFQNPQVSQYVHTVSAKFENASWFWHSAVVFFFLQKQSPEWINLKTITMCFSVDEDNRAFGKWRTVSVVRGRVAVKLTFVFGWHWFYFVIVWGPTDHSAVCVNIIYILLKTVSTNVYIPFCLAKKSFTYKEPLWGL